MTLPCPPELTIRRGVLSEAIHQLERRPEVWLGDQLGALIARLEHSFHADGFDAELQRVAPSLSGELRRLRWMRAAALVSLRRLEDEPLTRARRHALLALRAVQCAEQSLSYQAYWTEQEAQTPPRSRRATLR